MFNGRMLGEILGVSAAALLAYVLALWLVSLPLRDASIADPGWGLGFVLVAWLAFALGEGCRGRHLLMAVLVSVWGVRLTAYPLARKRRERREDPLISLGTVFLLQGALMWVASLPVSAAAPQPDALGPLCARRLHLGGGPRLRGTRRPPARDLQGGSRQ